MTYRSAYTGAEIDAAVGNHVKKTGDTMTGQLKIDCPGATLMLREGNALPEVGEVGVQKHTGSARLSLWVRTIAGSSAYVNTLTIENTEKELKYAVRFSRTLSGVGKGFYFLGTHNKPSGTYIGTGSAEKQTIYTDGIGHVLMITSGSGASALVSVAGAIFFTSNGSYGSLGFSEIQFKDGELILSTTNELFNKEGGSFNYQVL